LAAPDQVQLAEVFQAGQEAIPYWQQLHQQVVAGAKVILLLLLGLVDLVEEVQTGVRRHHLRVLELQLKGISVEMGQYLPITGVAAAAVQET
jgi:hypothetical protein